MMSAGESDGRMMGHGLVRRFGATTVTQANRGESYHSPRLSSRRHASVLFPLPPTENSAAVVDRLFVVPRDGFRTKPRLADERFAHHSESCNASSCGLPSNGDLWKFSFARVRLVDCLFAGPCGCDHQLARHS